MIDYPLLFNPIYVPKVWAGNKLSRVRGGKAEAKIGETWDISTYPHAPDNPDMSTVSIISNGRLAGTPLDKFIELPVVVKVIDSGDRLSVQNHPNTANEHKNEMWYILESEKDSYLYLDLKKDITKSEFCKRLEGGSESDILSSMNRFDNPNKGTFFNVPTGTVHALGPGLLTFEISEKQQITYRLYDYMRARSLGKLDIKAGSEALMAHRPDFIPLEPMMDIDAQTEIITQFETFCVIRANGTQIKVNSSKRYHLITASSSECVISGDGFSLTLPYTFTCLMPPTEKAYKVETKNNVLISPLLVK